MDLPPTAYLLISASGGTGDSWTPAPLTADIVCLGRPEADEAGPAYIDLDLLAVSRRHARILRGPEGYTLENWQGAYGVGVYERRLEVGARHALRHGDIFRIPDLPESHFSLLFLEGGKTQTLPLHMETRSHEVYVFGAPLRLTPLEYRLLRCLYERRGAICSYETIVATLWPDFLKTDRRADLDVLFARVRKKLRDASGGFTFMQTIRGEGVRLVV
jgi:hypothetical protein